MGLPICKAFQSDLPQFHTQSPRSSYTSQAPVFSLSSPRTPVCEEGMGNRQLFFAWSYHAKQSHPCLRWLTLSCHVEPTGCPGEMLVLSEPQCSSHLMSALSVLRRCYVSVAPQLTLVFVYERNEYLLFFNC